MAALARQPALYETSLNQVKTWVSNYFSDNDSATQAFIQNINELLSIDLAPTLPKISQTVEAIEKAAEQS